MIGMQSSAWSAVHQLGPGIHWSLLIHGNEIKHLNKDLGRFPGMFLFT